MSAMSISNTVDDVLLTDAVTVGPDLKFQNLLTLETRYFYKGFGAHYSTHFRLA